MEDDCLEEVAFKWMFHCGNIKQLQEQCQRYVNESTDNKMKEKSVYRLIFTVDVGELMDFNAQLGNIICNASEKAREIFQEACFICIQTLNWIPQIVSKSQIALQMRYLSVPHFLSCSSVFGLKRDLVESGYKSMPLFSTVGIVSGMTSRSNYTSSIWYKCLNTTCHSDIENGFAQHFSNCLGLDPLSEELICRGCGALLEEDISCRVLGEKCLIHVVSPDGFRLTNGCLLDKKSRLYRSLSVYVRDELINEVELGACYSLSLIPFREFYGTQNSTQLNLIFEANNLVKINQFPKKTSQYSVDSETTVSNDLPLLDSKFRNIQSLYQDRKTSPWSFASCMAYFFGDSMTPPGTYFRLKLGVLLSLVSQQSLNKEDKSSGSGGRLHILVVSKDVLLVQRLLLFSKSFSSRSITFSPCNDLCYSISKDLSNTGSCMIQSGCLPLANDGVCVLTNVDELKSDQIEELENVLQSESVNVEVPKKYIGCQQSHISVPVRCKIWVCCETSKKQGTRSHNTYQRLQENGRLSKALVDHFSLVFIIDDEIQSTENFAENLIVEDLLNKAIVAKKQSNYNIPDNEFFEFIQYVSARKLVFTEKARELIQGFYLSSRRVRSSSDHGGAEFPIAALKTMMSLAEAHARLSLGTEVTEDDAVLAILLYDESITARVGYSVLGVSPLNHFKDGNIMNYIGTENDKRMIQLKIHMKRFCSLHSHYKYIPGNFTHEE